MVKRVLLLFVLAIILLIGTNSAGWAGVPKLISKNDKEEVYKVIVKHGVKPFEVHLIYNDAKKDKVVEKIEVRRGRKVLQTFKFNDYDVEPPYSGAEYFQTEDVNFDGYKDIKFLTWWGVTGNLTWSFWLFDPLKDRFEYNKRLSDLETPNADRKGRTITSYYKGGAAGSIYYYQVFKWEGSKLILTREIEQDILKDRPGVHKVIKERRNGKMVVVSNRILSGDEAEDEDVNGTQLDH